MKPFGIAAFVFAIFGVIAPVIGIFLSGLSGLLAWFSAGKGITWGASAVIINLLNIIVLSPSFILVAHNKPDYQNIWVLLIFIQIITLLIFLVVWLVGRNKKNIAYNS